MDAPTSISKKHGVSFHRKFPCRPVYMRFPDGPESALHTNGQSVTNYLKLTMHKILAILLQKSWMCVYAGRRQNWRARSHRRVGETVPPDETALKPRGVIKMTVAKLIEFSFCKLASFHRFWIHTMMTCDLIQKKSITNVFLNRIVHVWGKRNAFAVYWLVNAYTIHRSI